MPFFLVLMDFSMSLCTCYVAYVAKKHFDEYRNLKTLQDAPVYEIGSDLKSLVESSPNQSLPYVVVRGVVSAVNGTVKNSEGTRGVLQSVNFQEVREGRFFWNGLSAWRESQKSSVPFALKSATDRSEKIRVEVQTPLESRYSGLLTTILNTFTPTNSSTGATLTGARTLGMKRSEELLPVGALVTAVGSIVKDPETGTFILKTAVVGNHSYPFILSTLSTEGIIAKLDDVKRISNRIFLAKEAALLLFYVGVRLYDVWRLRQIRNKQKPPVTTIPIENFEEWKAKALEADDVCECQTCLVCGINPREVIILNCGHVCVCTVCVKKVNRKCPVCRQDIAGAKSARIA